MDDELAPGTPWRRNLEEVGPELERWARKKVDANAGVGDVRAPGNGMSSETVLFTMEHGGNVERYCARLAPMPDVYPVFAAYDIALQHRCMDLVRTHTDVPAPEVRWIEQDPQWLGTPFLVMVAIDGEAPSDVPPYVFGGWVADATPEQRAGLQQQHVRDVHDERAVHRRLRREPRLLERIVCVGQLQQLVGVRQQPAVRQPQLHGVHHRRAVHGGHDLRGDAHLPRHRQQRAVRGGQLPRHLGRLHGRSVKELLN